MMTEKKYETAIHSSVAEYLTYAASIGDHADSMEMRYENENIWLTQRMMAQLYDVSERFAFGNGRDKSLKIIPFRAGQWIKNV